MAAKKEELVNKDLKSDMRETGDTEAPKETRPKEGDTDADK